MMVAVFPLFLGLPLNPIIFIASSQLSVIGDYTIVFAYTKGLLIWYTPSTLQGGIVS
jgi:hypothetical protein